MTTATSALKNLAGMMLLVGLAVFFPAVKGHADPPRAGSPASADEAFLDHLQGEWWLEGTVRGKAVRYRAHGERVLQGGFLRLQMIDAAAQPQYQANVYIGFDAKAHDYVAHWLDRFGAAGARVVATGHRDGERLVLMFPYAEGAFRDTFTFEPKSGTWTLLLESQEASGSWSKFATYTFVRA